MRCRRLALNAVLAVNAWAQSDIVLQASNASGKAGKWVVVSDSGAAGGRRSAKPTGVRQRSPAPSQARQLLRAHVLGDQGVPYRLWIHGRAEGDNWGNDSVFVQFAGSVTASGSATFRIGTSAATEVNLEACKGCGP